MSEKSSTARICKFSTAVKCHPKRFLVCDNKDTVRASGSMLSVAGETIPQTVVVYGCSVVYSVVVCCLFCCHSIQKDFCFIYL